MTNEGGNIRTIYVLGMGREGRNSKEKETLIFYGTSYV